MLADVLTLDVVLQDAVKLAQKHFEKLQLADAASIRFFARVDWKDRSALALLPESSWTTGVLKSGAIVEVDTPSTAPATRRCAGAVYQDRNNKWVGPRPVLPGPDVDAVTLYYD
ncbi:hypothetical protein PsYK624_076250 [Phanerochaete sordida]|uniref:Uncharacterized protein n=1 Tax=Phanerochaete sordida TaxID=48140 RepID=A0A9P3GBA6_9APHY|nr:hypothetical protein PsYK624_076250 [Phanerochaete sordida]